MTDRDHGDGPDDPEELGAAADPAVARSRKATRQGRRRSLRVPVDDVPRRSASNIDLPAIPDLDGDGLPALAAEPTQVAPVPIESAAFDGARPTDNHPSVEVGLDLADDDLQDDDLDADHLDAADLDGGDLDAADLEAALAASEELAETSPRASERPAPSTMPMLDAPTTGDALADDLAARAFAADGSGADLETEPTRAAPPLSDVMPPPAWVAASAAPFVPGAGVAGRPLSVPPPSVVAAAAAARPLTVPPPARPASVPPSSRPASIPPPRPASVPPPASAKPASVPPPASAKPASVPPPAPLAEPGAPVSIEAGSQEAVTSPGTTSTPNAEPQRAPRADQPAVVVARTVRVSAPPPAPLPLPTAIDDEPELSVGEVDSFDDLDIDDDRDSMETRPRDSAPDLTDEAFEEADGSSSAELELPEEDALDVDESVIPALRPPPPPREAVRSEPRPDLPAAELAPPASDPEHEEELHDLEVDPGTDLEGASPEERRAHAEAKLRSAPPPPPEKTPKGATPPEMPKAAAATAAEPASEPARKKKKAEWWEDFFNDDYLRTVPAPHPRQIARQCDFIEARFGLKEGGTILDVGCGLGLHAIELTRRGYLVVGLDLSLPMLSRAADEAQDQGFRINFLHADMKEMNFEGAFDAVMCIGTTYGYFDDDANRAVVERLYRALKPKGKLLLEVVNRDFVVRSQPNLVWFEGDGCVVMEETKANYISSRLEVKRTVILDDGRQRDNAYSVRLYALHELGLVLHQRGFRVLEVSGREATPGVFFGADSPKVIILAERRVQQAPPPPKKPGAASEGAPTGEMMPLDASQATEPTGNSSES